MQLLRSIPKGLLKTDLHDQTGMSIVELLVALTILFLVVPLLATLGWLMEQSIITDSYHDQAITKAEQALAEIRFHAQHDFTHLISSSTHDPIFQTTITITPVDPHTKRANVTVSWQVFRTPLHQISLSQTLSDWPVGLTGNTCAMPWPDWTQPKIRGSLNLNSSNQPTNVTIRASWAFITANSSSATDPDFLVVDISNPLKPTLVAQLNTGPGLKSLAINGSYAYVGNTSINAQLQIIDITDPRNPFLITNYKLPGTYSDNTTIANTVVYADHKVYMGTAKSMISEFHAIDVSDIHHPVERGSWELNAGINAIVIQGDWAYVASPDSEELKILDISNPAIIHQVGGFNPPGGSGNGKSLALINTTLFLGRTVGNSELYLLDVYNGLSPRSLSQQTLGTSIVDIAATPALLFLATTKPGKNLQVWDVTRPTSPLVISTLEVEGTATGLACGHDAVYLTMANPNSFNVITPYIP